MATWARGCGVLGVLAVGYVLGAAGVFAPAMLHAQAQKETISDDAAMKVNAAIKATADAQLTLQNEQRHLGATTGINAFAILSGGVNALEDLKSGHGVDPETFAALYAGMAVDEVKAKLSKDEDGRLTYDGVVVKLYPISKLKQMFAERERLQNLKGSTK